MANIFCTSIGKKLIMSISGLFLILFLFVHATINAFSLISPELFEMGCEFMALPIVGILVPVLAAGFIIHIVYAFILNLINYRARGKERYAVANKAATEDWGARNMLLLGIIVLGVLAFHLTHFWAHMQLPAWTGGEETNPVVLLGKTFGNPIVLAIYIVWFIALWFHLTHGFWSALQTLGWNNQIWLKRWMAISYVIATILVLVFIAVALNSYFVFASPML